MVSAARLLPCRRNGILIDANNPAGDNTLCKAAFPEYLRRHNQSSNSNNRNNMKRKLIALLLIISVVTSCKQEPGGSAATTGNEKLIQQYYEHFNRHDWKAMAALYSETADFKDPSLGTGIVRQTRQQIIDKYAGLQKTFPDIHDRVVQTYPSGPDKIIVEFISTGTAPDSTKFELPICTIFTIEKGLITKDYTYYDNFEEPQPE